MDSRDSSLWQPTPATAREPSSAEDDAVLSVTAALAKDAAHHFQSRRFPECLEKRSEELAQASSEQVEVINNVGNKVNSGTRGSGVSAHQFSATSSASLVYMDEFDPAVVTLNIAIIWFHLHEYMKAMSVLEPLYRNIEPIDETIALHVCLLLLDVTLACQDTAKSVDVLIYLEKAFGVGSVSQGDNGSMAQLQSSNLAARSFSVLSSSSAINVPNSDSASGGIALESSLSRSLSLSEESLEYETMFSLDIGGQNVARAVGLSSSNDISRPTVDGSLSTVDLKLTLQLYRVRFWLLTRNLKQAKREVKLAVNIARGRDSSMALLLKSQLEYARGNHRKAIKLLMASSNSSEVGISSMFNNLGCIYFQLGNYYTSSILFSKALTSSSSLRKDKPPKLLNFSQDKSLLIVYNCGVQHLACGKPMLAARCFQQSSLVFCNRPILWLRLAECCLMALEKGLLKSGQALLDRSEIVVHVVGKGKWRHLAIDDGFLRNEPEDSFEGENLFLGSDGQPKLSLSLARQCLFNGLHLLDSSVLDHLQSGLPSDLSLEENESSERGSVKNLNHKNLIGLDHNPSATSPEGQANSNGDAKEQKGGTNQETLQTSVTFYEDIRARENHLIMQALLANLAYVELELANPEKALSTAKSLLELKDCSRIYVFLGHVYAAEALCWMNKPKEAAEHLSNYLSGGDDVTVPFNQEDRDQWRVEKTLDCEELNGGSIPARNSPMEGLRGLVFLTPEEARGVLYANFSTLYALQGDLERAHHFVTQALSIVPDSPQATLTAVYVDLMFGNSQAAIAKLKQCSRVRFVRGYVKLNRS